MAVELNPKMETLLLLTISDWSAEDKAMAIKELDNIGVDGKDFYNRHFRVVEKYYAAFQKHKVDSPGAKLLASMDVFLLGVYACILWKHPDWFEGIGGIPDEVVDWEVNNALATIAESSGDMIAVLESMGLSSDTKWQIMVLKQQPKKQLETVAAAVMDNLPAYENAREKVAAELETLLASTGAMFNDPDKTRLLQLSHKVAPNAVIVPTLAFPVAVLALDEVVFYGLMGNKVMSGGAEFTKEELLAGAKALSEKSKLEILLSLKNTALYSSEIADKVGLTSATVSYHMNALLTTGFVSLERRDGKVYYQLAPKGIRRFIEGVSQLLF